MSASDSFSAEERVAEVEALVTEQGKALKRFHHVHDKVHGHPTKRVVESLFTLFDKQLTLNEILRSEVADSYAAREVARFFSRIRGIFGREFDDLDDIADYVETFVVDFDEIAAGNDRLKRVLEQEKKSAEITKRTVAGLEAENRLLKKGSESGNAEQSRLQQDMDEILVRMRELQRTLRSEQSANAELDAKNGILLDNVEALKRKVHELEAMNRAKVEEYQIIATELFQARRTVDEEKRNARIRETEEFRLRATLEDECAAIDEARQVAEAKWQVMQQKSEELEEVVRLFEAKMKSIMFENERQEIDLESAHEVVKALRRENDRFADRLTSREVRMAGVEREYMSTKEAALANEAQATSFMAQSKRIENRYLACKRQMSVMKVEIEHLRGVNETLQSLLDSRTDNPGTFRVGSVSKKITRLNTDISTMQNAHS